MWRHYLPHLCCFSCKLTPTVKWARVQAAATRLSVSNLWNTLYRLMCYVRCFMIYPDRIDCHSARQKHHLTETQRDHHFMTLLCLQIKSIINIPWAWGFSQPGLLALPGAPATPEENIWASILSSVMKALCCFMLNWSGLSLFPHKTGCLDEAKTCKNAWTLSLFCNHTTHYRPLFHW